MRFKGKVAIVTGGSSGIGKETAKQLVAEGASVVLSGKDDAKLQSAAREIGGIAGQVRVLVGDIAKPATGAALVERAEQDFGGLDILVSNAGVSSQSHSTRLLRMSTTGFSTLSSRESSL